MEGGKGKQDSPRSPHFSQPFRLPGAFLANRQTFPSSSSSSSFSSYLLAFDYNFPTIRTTYLPSVWSPFQTIRHFQACDPYSSLFSKKGPDQGQESPFQFWRRQVNVLGVFFFNTNDDAACWQCSLVCKFCVGVIFTWFRFSLEKTFFCIASAIKCHFPAAKMWDNQIIDF